jgi:hypothetical protein
VGFLVCLFFHSELGLGNKGVYRGSRVFSFPNLSQFQQSKGYYRVLSVSFFHSELGLRKEGVYRGSLLCSKWFQFQKNNGSHSVQHHSLEETRIHIGRRGLFGSLGGFLDTVGVKNSLYRTFEVNW